MNGSQGLGRFWHWCSRTRNYKKRFMIHFFLKKRIENEFYKEMGYRLDLSHPRTLNEKLQWFKMYVRDPMITLCADKYAVRGYVAKKIGKQYLVPLYGVYSSIREIDLKKLPEQFVLKPNHSSNRVIICRDKSAMDWVEEADKMDNWLHENYYYWTAEWGYKNIPPKIICEKFLSDEIIDYRFFCFQGNPVLVKLTGKEKDGFHYRTGFFDPDFRTIPLNEQNNERNIIASKPFQQPPHWDTMIAISRELSREFPFVRVDLYNLEGKIYFSELTFTPENGMEKDYPEGWDQKMGDMFDLSVFDSRYVLKER